MEEWVRFKCNTVTDYDKLREQIMEWEIKAEQGNRGALFDNKENSLSNVNPSPKPHSEEWSEYDPWQDYYDEWNNYDQYKEAPLDAIGEGTNLGKGL